MNTRPSQMHQDYETGSWMENGGKIKWESKQSRNSQTYSHTSQESSADNQEQTDGSNEIPEMENKGEIKGESADNQEKTDGSDIVICA